MDAKKWPVLAQVLIALGVIGGLMGFLGGLQLLNPLTACFGILALVVYWNVYKFKAWALKALMVLLSVNIIFGLLGTLASKIPLLPGIFTVVINSLILYYFNSKEIKPLFENELEVLDV